MQFPTWIGAISELLSEPLTITSWRDLMISRVGAALRRAATNHRQRHRYRIGKAFYHLIFMQ